MYKPSQLCDSSPAVSANAHVITDAVAREVPSCYLCAFKRSKNVLPHDAILGILDPTQVQENKKNHFEHVFPARCCRLFPMLIQLNFLHNIKWLQKSWIWHWKLNYYNDFFQFSDLKETFIFLNIDSLLTMTLGRKWIFARCFVPTCLQSNFNFIIMGCLKSDILLWFVRGSRLQLVS